MYQAVKSHHRFLHELIVSCRNDQCSASFAASLEMVRPVQNSINPNPEVQTGLPQHKRQWENELEHHLASLEIQTEIDVHQKNYVEGFISALFHSSTIDLTSGIYLPPTTSTN